MRILAAIIVIIATTVALAQTLPASTRLEGSWKSPDLGLDFPIWMVDTYNVDCSVQTDFYSKPRDKEIHHTDKTGQARWRIVNSTLEIGTLNKAGEFARQGQPRRIRTDPSGEVVAIEGWTRITSPATQPTSQPSRAK